MRMNCLLRSILERRALLGDRQAQEECTEKGIMLPCPFCGGKAMIEYDDIMPFEYSAFCEDCGVMPSVSEDKQVAISVWNTRPAPPIGRCKDFEHYTLLGHCKIHSQGPDEHGPGAYVEMLPDDFCSYFVNRGARCNLTQTITDLQREIRGQRELGQLDGNELRGIESLLNTDIIQSSMEASWLMSQVLHDIDAMPTIDPETLPIVRELRKELERVTAERDAARRDCAVAESNHFECLAQLAEARVQLKSAITDIEALMWHSGDGCNICKHCVEVHREPYVRLACGLGSGCECKPKWRGSDGDHP